MPSITPHDCKSELQEASLKATPARLAILKKLEETPTPLDASSLIKTLSLEGIGVDKVTVFRILNIFSQKGLILPIQLGEGKTRYEYKGKNDHHHFVCEKCGKLEDISDCNIERIEKDIQLKKGLLVKRHSLEFFGLCKNCQQ